MSIVSDSCAARGEPFHRVDVAGARAEAVLASDLLGWRVGRCQCACGSSVKIATDGGGQVEVDRLTKQVVAERQLVAAADDERRVDCLAQCGRDVDHAPSRNGGQVDEREPVAEQAGEAKRLDGGLGESRDAARQRAGEVRKDVAGGDLGDAAFDSQRVRIVEGTDELNDEQGVTGGGFQAGQECRPGGRADRRRSELRHPGRFETGERDLHRTVLRAYLKELTDVWRARSWSQGGDDADRQRADPAGQRSQLRAG